MPSMLRGFCTLRAIFPRHIGFLRMRLALLQQQPILSHSERYYHLLILNLRHQYAWYSLPLFHYLDFVTGIPLRLLKSKNAPIINSLSTVFLC
ncbi:hypothetical protein ABKN59_004893 [Abortiporus biennis]